ncbi:MAG: class I SAM-dependent methyltransferase [Alcanivorax sp.]|nr:class I SAM-dependent methyltransferase [Alcanivorax sp.]
MPESTEPTGSPRNSPTDWRSPAYQQFRPRYPDALFDWLARHSPATGRVLDCGCGTGQASTPLAARFTQVIASDLVQTQLAAFDAPANCQRLVADSGALPLPDQCLDLLTVAQALHWFDLPAFVNEARRTLRPGGLLAVWTYGLCDIAGEAGQLVRDFHDRTLAPWWAPSRAHVVDGYRQLALPWPLLAAPTLTLRYAWHWQDMLGYLGTWSAVIAARAQGHDPLAALAPVLADAWGEHPRTVIWPLHIKAAVRP